MASLIFKVILVLSVLFLSSATPMPFTNPIPPPFSPCDLPEDLWELMANIAPVIGHLYPGRRDLAAVESFSGAATIASSAQEMIGPSMCFDIAYTSEQDICSDSGFQRLIRLVLRIMPGGLLWLAPVCSTWVWIARKGTGLRTNHIRLNLVHPWLFTSPQPRTWWFPHGPQDTSIGFDPEGTRHPWGAQASL